MRNHFLKTLKPGVKKIDLPSGRCFFIDRRWRPRDVFKNYIVKRKNVFYELSTEKQIDYIDHAIHKDMKFRNSIKGMIIGQFTIEEYSKYITNSSALNKRMMNLVMQRLINQLQLLQEPLELRVS